MREVGRGSNERERKRANSPWILFLALARKEVPGVSSWAGHVGLLRGPPNRVGSRPIISINKPLFEGPVRVLLSGTLSEVHKISTILQEFPAEKFSASF